MKKTTNGVRKPASTVAVSNRLMGEVISHLIEYYGGRSEKFSDHEQSVALFKLMPKVCSIANCAASSKDRYLRQRLKDLLEQRAKYEKHRQEQERVRLRRPAETPINE